jgi:DNA helicase-2/ATP-dependent DNA helicase PcrA
LASDIEPTRAAAINRVAMMTAHSAKGKEWPLVFIIGAEDGEFPFWRTEDDDEERRILYVAMTRAREPLCILWARETKGRTRQVSRFLRDLPTEFIQHRP